jgi:hypothetical protein
MSQVTTRQPAAVRASTKPEATHDSSDELANPWVSTIWRRAGGPCVLTWTGIPSDIVISATADDRISKI